MHHAHSPEQRRYLPTYENCFVCGGHHPRGLRLRFFTCGGGISRVEFTPEDSLTGYEEIVHGGVIATVFDELLGWSVGIKTDQLFFTGELTVRYLRPILSNRTYQGSAYPVEDKKRYWIAEGELKDQDDTLYARASGKYFPMGVEKTRDFAVKLTYQPDDLPIFLNSGD
jgi:uncharacterized protein (TIGR00369 family)